MQDPQGIQVWAAEQFESANFGDVRRQYRARSMLARAAERPAGQLTQVFTSPAELQGAYDFFEGRVSSRALTTAIAEGSLRAVGDAAAVYVVIDGTSLTLVDHTKTKGFGSIGKREFPTQGVKVIDALAVAMDGTPIGLLGMEWWVRTSKPTASRHELRRTGQTETKYWLEVVRQTTELVHEQTPDCVPWLVIDREGDNAEILRAAAKPNQWFTIRAAQDRPVLLPHDRRRLLRAHMKKQRVSGAHVVDVPAGPNRPARRAVLDVRFADVVLELPEYSTNRRLPLPVRVVWAHERRAPRGAARLDWMLLTNREVASLDDAIGIVQSYCHRWRVEDFHRAWKRGHCNVEDSQLRTPERIMRWATMLAAVATHVERLKYLARTHPDAPASIALSALEIQALRAERRRIKSRGEAIPNGMPTIAQAVRWIADIGGYTGKSSGGPPGATTIGRGLERLTIWADGFACGKGMR